LVPRPLDDHDTPRWGWPARWQKVPTAWCVTVCVLCTWLFLALWTDDDGYLVGLDGLNLIVHEGGHFLCAWFGSTLELYGGTILQLAVPLLLAAAFVRRAEAPGVSLCLVWFFQNFLNVARYLGDARAQELPLVGGGEHDWFNILGRWHLLQYDTRIAGVLRVIAWLGMITAWGWLIWRWLRDRQTRVAED
jgi:hypothetical protein